MDIVSTSGQRSREINLAFVPNRITKFHLAHVRIGDGLVIIHQIGCSELSGNVSGDYSDCTSVMMFIESSVGKAFKMVLMDH